MSNVHLTVNGFVNRATFRKEESVKRVIRRILDHYNFFNFMPPANTYGKAGISDILTVGNTRLVAIEAKYGSNKPTANQLDFGNDIERSGAMFAVINEKNIAAEMIRVITYLETGVDTHEPQ